MAGFIRLFGFSSRINFWCILIVIRSVTRHMLIAQTVGQHLKFTFMKYLSRFLILTIFYCFSICGVSQNVKDVVPEKDLIAVTKVVIDFYNWYIKVVSHTIIDIYQPEFVKNKNGMSTLDFNKYIMNLKQKKFSDGFIKNIIDNYKPCFDNLKKIPYDTLLSYDNIDSYSKINCDFFDSNQWFDGMMDCPIGTDIIKVEYLENNRGLKVSIKFYDYKSDSTTSYWSFPKVEVNVIKLNGNWKIDNIHFR